MTDTNKAQELRPPEVVIDNRGATVLFTGQRQWCIEWHEVTEIAIRVSEGVLDPGEAFWELKGGPTIFGAPIDLIVGGQALNDKLTSFLGFDHKALAKARDAERLGENALISCWRRADTQQGIQVDLPTAGRLT